MKKVLTIALMALLFVSCESEDGSAEQAMNDFQYQSTSGACGYEVVSNYNSSVLDCMTILDRSDIYECQESLQSFKNQYPGINCQVENLENGETFTITESYINSLLDQAQNL